MKQPLDIRFLGMERSASVEAAARDQAAKLALFCPDLMSCRVTIEALHRHEHQGFPYAVRIDATLPGHELTVDRVTDEDVALREAFDSMRHQIQDTMRRLQRQE